MVHTPRSAGTLTGIARGRVGTPPVDVPVDVLSSVPGPTADMLCLLAGSTRPLPAERLAELYTSSDDYLQKYDSHGRHDQRGLRRRRRPRHTARLRPAGSHPRL